MSRERTRPSNTGGLILLGSIMAAALASASPLAGCETATLDAQRSSCLLQEVEASDQEINANYAAVRARLGATGRLDLQAAQRAWIKRRDRACHIDNSQGDRAAWLASVAQDYAKTVCVVRFTDERATELEAQARQPNAVTEVGRAAPQSPATAEVYDVAASAAHSTGKWYFETTVDVGRLAQTSEQALFIGVKSPYQSTGTLLTIHKRDATRGSVNVGVAVDLDAGKLYLRDNGAWRNGPPGSSGGEDLPLGRPYQGWVSSSSSLSRALASHILAPNLGQQAFVYALPDGYQPMDTQPPEPVLER